MALQSEISAFNSAVFYELIRYPYFIAVVLFFGGFLISAIFYSKLSLYLYYMAFFTTLLFLLVSLYGNFNKAILFIIFFYCVLSYFLGQGWKQMLHFACYNAYVSSKNLDSPIAIGIEVSIETKDNKIYPGHLMNWDEMSCFIGFDYSHMDKLSGHVKIITKYNGKVFTNWAKVVSYVEGGGIGVIFDWDGANRFNWQDFYNILDEISFNPEYLIH